MKKYCTLLMVSLVLTFFIPLSNYSIDLDSLLVKSIGGKKALETIKGIETIYSSGKVIINGIEGSFEQFFQTPDKFLLYVDLKSFKLIQGFDGNIAWQTDINGTASEMTGFEKRELLKTIYFESYAYLHEANKNKVEYLREEKSETGNFHVVAFYPLPTDTIITYFETNSGIRTLIEGRMDNLATVVFVDDYRETDNILYPFYSRAEAKTAKITTEFILDKLIFNEPIDAQRFKMPTPQTDSYRFSSETNSFTIPFEYKFGHIRLPVKINGKKKVWMILDSGASSSIFHQPSIKDLNLSVVGTIPAKGIGGYAKAELIKVDSLEVGDLTLFNNINGSMNLSGLARRGPDQNEFGGILGYDFLSKFPVLIDYKNRIMTVFNPDSFSPPEGGDEIRFELTMQVPTVTASIEGITGKFIVDLGNAFGLIIHKPFAKTHDLEAKLQNLIKNRSQIGGIGGFASGKTGDAAYFRIGDIQIDSLRVLLPEYSDGITGSNELAGNIGNLVLENFRLLLDYSQSRLFLYPTQ